MSITSADLRDTLAMVNVVRQALGFEMLSELPDSAPGQAANCLYYRALADCGAKSVSGGGTIDFGDERKASYVAHLLGTTAHGTRVETPKQFERVIGKFDGHKLPHYNTTDKKHF